MILKYEMKFKNVLGSGNDFLRFQKRNKNRNRFRIKLFKMSKGEIKIGPYSGYGYLK